MYTNAFKKSPRYCTNIYVKDIIRQLIYIVEINNTILQKYYEDIKKN